MNKIKILVLDAFTNGHNAAIEFVKRRKLQSSDYEIIFCGTHKKVLQKLTEGPAVAVVPIFNSIAGEVTEVTLPLQELLEKGYEFFERDKIDLPISHCLLAPSHITSVEKIEKIFSHERAIQQCGKYLDSIGIVLGARNRHDSTGNSAKVVSRLDQREMAAAIAPKEAAAEYGLKILATDIQDSSDNYTTFVLLENKAKIESVTVGIIGIAGKFGRMFEKLFKQAGCTVIGSDLIPDGINARAVVEQSSVVIFTTPLDVTPKIIMSLRKYIRHDQLLIDITSNKIPSMTAMLETSAQVVGLHPMFRPEDSFSGQKIVVCPERLMIFRWKTFLVNVLAEMGANIKWSTASEHDECMMPVQVMPHSANLVNALLVTDMNLSVSNSLDFASPFYRVMFSLMGRLISQDPDLYTSIIMDNPGTLDMLEKRIEIEKRLIEMIRIGDRKSFKRLFVIARNHFGDSVTTEANELFMRILAIFDTLYGKDSVILECSKNESRPGLLKRILEVFDNRGINLLGLNTVNLPVNRLQFTIKFEQSSASHDVRRALEEIENWVEPRFKIVVQ